MSFHTLDLTNRHQISSILAEDKWMVACLCAAWCDVCRHYRIRFENLAARHPDKHFIWIDIEDQADVVGDFDVENFPTLLIQRSDMVVFLGTVLPEIGQANRLLDALASKTEAELLSEAAGSTERKKWQNEYNLRRCLRSAIKD